MIKITPEQFIDALAKSNISLDQKKEILGDLKYYSETEIEFVYNTLKENIHKQRKIIAEYKQRKKMLDLDFEVKIKSELKKYKDVDLKNIMLQELRHKDKKKKDSII